LEHLLFGQLRSNLLASIWLFSSSVMGSQSLLSLYVDICWNPIKILLGLGEVELLLQSELHGVEMIDLPLGWNQDQYEVHPEFWTHSFTFW
jgi:hypothetical protein